MEMAKDLEPIRNFPINKVQYGGEKRLPFQLINDVPRIIEKAIKALNIGKNNAKENDSGTGTDNKTTLPEKK